MPIESGESPVVRRVGQPIGNAFIPIQLRCWSCDPHLVMTGLGRHPVRRSVWFPCHTVLRPATLELGQDAIARTFLYPRARKSPQPRSLTGRGRWTSLQGCGIGGSPPRYWTGGRAVECTSLENWRTRKGIESSNLSLSAFSSRRHVWTAASFFS